jgi:hypothetical protein
MSGGKIPSYIDDAANTEARRIANLNANQGGDGTPRPVSERLLHLEASVAMLQERIQRLEGQE